MLKKNDLIVSCQALENEPLHSSFIMGRMAKAAVIGGANAIRANSIVDIKEIKSNVDVPIIGIIKKTYPSCPLHITVTMKEIDELIAVGCDIIAMDATQRLRPDNQSLEQFFKKVKSKYPKQLFMADCSTVEEMLIADALGFDYIGTTLFGYTNYTKYSALANDGELLKLAVNQIKAPIIAEGNVNTPELARLAQEIGAYAIVVGSMITRPQIITSTFKKALN